jgi:cytochrome c-type biogenesis protein CcmE
MKKSHIVLLVLVAAAVCVIVSMFGDFSTYETFASAAKQPGKSFHVIGYLDKDKAMDYDPLKDPNHFTFYAKDKSGNINKVIFNGEKPRDIEHSEQIVMKGYVQGDAFHCTGIQMKCPSKYKKNNMTVTGNAS